MNNKWTVEFGASWLQASADSPVYRMARKYGLNLTLQNFVDFYDSTYQYNPNTTDDAVKIPAMEVQDTFEDWLRAYHCLNMKTLPYWYPQAHKTMNTDQPPFVDIGMLDFLEERCGWVADTPLKWSSQVRLSIDSTSEEGDLTLPVVVSVDMDRL